MRVITGEARGRKLKEPKGNDIRPTTDMVKEAVFNIIQFDIEGRRVLDLFAGTGQLGIESLSRGAKSAVFVDQSREAAELVKDNLKSCGFEGQVIQTDSISYLENCGKFDIIFVDPPYNSNLSASALQKIYRFDILTDGGIIICETKNEAVLPTLASPYYYGREYRYGKVKLTIIRREVD